MQNIDLYAEEFDEKLLESIYKYFDVQISTYRKSSATLLNCVQKNKYLIKSSVMTDRKL
jgi:hypothetical protein